MAQEIHADEDHHGNSVSRVSTLTTQDKPLVNVTDSKFGAIGDGDQDDYTALQDAIDHAVSIGGTVYVPPEATCKFSSDLDFSYGNTDPHGKIIDVQGSLIPDEATLSIHDIGQSWGNITIHNGNATTNGISRAAIEVYDTLNFSLNIYSKNFPGTTLEVNNTVGNAGGFSLGNFFAEKPGRPLYWHDVGGVGTIQNAWVNNPQVEDSLFSNVNDLCIGQYENYITSNASSGLRFEDCDALWLDKIQLGGDRDGTNDFTGTLLSIERSNKWRVQSCYLLSTEGNAAFLDEVSAGTARFNIKNHGGYGLKIDETGTTHDTNRNRISAQIRTIDGRGLWITSNVSAADINEITGNVTLCGEGGSVPGAEIDTTGTIHLINMRISNPNATSDLNLPSNNDTRLMSCKTINVAGSSPKKRNALGKEAAGSGNSPTAGNWQPGDLVENTDDSTVWVLLEDNSSWIQLG